jgi:hypothetical protein
MFTLLFLERQGRFPLRVTNRDSLSPKTLAANETVTLLIEFLPLFYLSLFGGDVLSASLERGVNIHPN